MSGIAERYRLIQEKVSRAALASGHDPSEITLLAVSKTQPVEAIEELYRLGHRDFGENYVQELVEKSAVLESRGCSGIRWHMIGHLQTNKAKAVCGHAAFVHSVDSEKLALELAKRWRASDRAGRLPIFLEVNLDEEESKTGLIPGTTPAVASTLAAIPELELLGLMAIPSPDSGTSAFDRLRELETRCRPATKGKLSMGMSGDFETAIAAGATHVRVGTSIFGARKL